MNETLDTTNHAPPPRSFSEAITVCFSKYADFTGRASRSEFWWFELFYNLLWWGAGIFGAVTDEPYDITYWTVLLALLIPSLAVGARRLHDINRSGWWQLLHVTIIGIPLLVYWWAKKGESEQNEYDVE